jgi:flagellar biosynthesis protein FlhG
MGKTNRDLALGSKLRQIVNKNLEINMEYIGFIPHEEEVGRSVLERKPASLLLPNSQFTRSINTIAQKLVAAPVPKEFKLYESDEDLTELFEEQEETPQG